MKEYLVVYEQADDGGWGAHSPDVEGVFALGHENLERRMRMQNDENGSAVADRLPFSSF